MRQALFGISWKRLGRLVQSAIAVQSAMVAVSVALPGCGYSQEEWDQKVRENETLRSQLAAQEQARGKCDADYAAALHDIEGLRAQLRERGVDLENLTQSLEEQNRATEEYRARLAQLNEIRERFRALQEKLKKLTQLGLQVVVRDNRMVIQLPGDVLFDSGEARLRHQGEEILAAIAEVIRNDPELARREFQVAGHTDSQPLKREPFKDNWGLSAMRARSVLVFLTEPTDKRGGGLDPSHLSAAGYADTDPVSNNDTPEGRERNRRVELVVMPNVEEMLDLESLVR
jgi:chemotaxis protein MotB